MRSFREPKKTKNKNPQLIFDFSFITIVCYILLLSPSNVEYAMYERNKKDLHNVNKIEQSHCISRKSKRRRGRGEALSLFAGRWCVWLLLRSKDGYLFLHRLLREKRHTMISTYLPRNKNPKPHRSEGSAFRIHYYDGSGIILLLSL